MSFGHEYSVVGHRRAKIGAFLSGVSGIAAGFFAYAADQIVDVLRKVTQIDVPAVATYPITGALVFAGLYLLFSAYLWKISWLRMAVGIPDISGIWAVHGHSFKDKNSTPIDWQGEIIISQQYETIHIELKTSQSRSDSKSAAIIPRGKSGFLLVYSYENRPKPGEFDLNSHLGHCELHFDCSLVSASGTYFTGSGRNTSGTMELKRKSSIG